MILSTHTHTKHNITAYTLNHFDVGIKGCVSHIDVSFTLCMTSFVICVCLCLDSLFENHVSVEIVLTGYGCCLCYSCRCQCCIRLGPHSIQHFHIPTFPGRDLYANYGGCYWLHQLPTESSFVRNHNVFGLCTFNVYHKPRLIRIVCAYSRKNRHIKI